MPDKGMVPVFPDALLLRFHSDGRTMCTTGRVAFIGMNPGWNLLGSDSKAMGSDQLSMTHSLGRSGGGTLTRTPYDQ